MLDGDRSGAAGDELAAAVRAVDVAELRAGRTGNAHNLYAGKGAGQVHLGTRRRQYRGAKTEVTRKDGCVHGGAAKTPGGVIFLREQVLDSMADDQEFGRPAFRAGGDHCLGS